MSRGVLLVSAGALSFSWKEHGGGACQTLEFPFAASARKGQEDRVEVQVPPERPAEPADDEIRVEALGALLSGDVEQDLVDALVSAVARDVAGKMPQTAKGITYLLLFPPWMGPEVRRRLISCLHWGGLVVEEGIERGLAIALGSAPAAEDGSDADTWIVADRSGDDLDLYGLARRDGASADRWVLEGYQRCRRLMSSYFTSRRSEQRNAVSAALSGPGWTGPIILTDPAAEPLFTESESPVVLRPGWVGRVIDEIAAPETFQRVLLDRRGRYWLGVGGDRLEELGGVESPGQEMGPWRRLYELPAPPPQEVVIDLRYGYGPTKDETFPLGTAHLRRGKNFFAVGGHLLIAVRVARAGGGSVEWEVLQRGAITEQRGFSFASPRGA